MIDRYLARGDLYVRSIGPEVVAVAVVTREARGVVELKNLAVAPTRRRMGYGRQMVTYIGRRYARSCHTLYVGTGDSPLTLPFYERCGFRRSHAVRHFFIDHYDHPIIEGGRRLIDMIYLKKSLSAPT